MFDAVIVGAGIAGLSAAWELRARGIAPLVLEQTHRAGGVIVTQRSDGFVIDSGPDSLLSQKLAAIELVRELGLADRLVSTLSPRTAFVLKAGRLIPLPEASFLGLPTRLGPLVSTQLFSWPAKVRMAVELLMAAKREVHDESIGSFMRRHFGQEAVRYLAEPLLAGIHAGDVDRLSVHALFPRLVEAERTYGSVLRALFAAPPPSEGHSAFVSFPTGLAELVETLARTLGEETIQYNSGVRQIEKAAPGSFNIKMTSGDTIEARTVIVATPSGSAASVIRPVDPALAALCAGIPYASSATAAFGLRRDQVGHPLNGSGFVVPREEKRALKAATWVSSKWPQRAPAGHVLMRGFLGGATDPDVLEKSDYELAKTAFDDLAAILDISGAPSLIRLYRWSHATPQYLVGHLERVRQIDERLSQRPGLYLTGSSYRGTGIPDCVSDARATAANAAAFLR